MQLLIPFCSPINAVNAAINAVNVTINALYSPINDIITIAENIYPTINKMLHG